uniref:Uncharacterized protein n=1 Tax=Salix viminalis TaxID=40686 RepID=A0A6N2NFF8_SALVM
MSSVASNLFEMGLSVSNLVAGLLVTVVQNFATSPSLTADGANQNWCLDSGATHHMTTNASSLPNAHPYTGTDKIIVGNGNHPQLLQDKRSRELAFKQHQ